MCVCIRPIKKLFSFKPNIHLNQYAQVFLPALESSQMQLHLQQASPRHGLYTALLTN